MGEKMKVYTDFISKHEYCFILAIRLILLGFVCLNFSYAFAEGSWHERRPRPIPWSELKLTHNIGLATAEQLNVDGCPADIKLLPNISGKESRFVLQNLLYSQYVWLQHPLLNGRKCIELIVPDEGLLSEIDARILLSASNGLNFENYDYQLNAALYNLYNYTRNCTINIAQEDDASETENKKQSSIDITDDFGVLHEDDYSGDNESGLFIDWRTQFKSTIKHVPYIWSSTEDALPEAFFDSECVQSFMAEAGLSKVLGDEGVPNQVLSNADVDGLWDQVDNRRLVLDQSLPWAAVADAVFFAEANQGAVSRDGSVFFIDPNKGLTAAHNIKMFVDGTCTLVGEATSYSIKLHNSTIWNRSDITPRFSSGYVHGNGCPGVVNDYGAIFLQPSFYAPFYNRSILNGRNDICVAAASLMTIAGFPFKVYHNDIVNGESNVLLYEYDGCSIDLPHVTSSLIPNRVDKTSGQSGGPAYLGALPTIIPSIVGINAVRAIDSFTNQLYNFEVELTQAKVNEINGWIAPTIIIDVASPVPSQVLNRLAPGIFQAMASGRFYDTDTSGASSGDPTEAINWSTNLAGSLGSGSVIGTGVLQQKLVPGDHIVKVSVILGDNWGERNIPITVIGPDGGFDMQTFYCVVNLSSPQNNTCTIAIDWFVMDSPSSGVVWNVTESNLFATGNNGPANWQANTQGTTFTLHESPDRILTLDEITVDAKIPTGHLTADLNVCALEPKPTVPDGSPRDPTATPPGCGVTLSWANVSYAGPHIFYRPVGQSGWIHLHSIPFCGAGPCSGSVNTDDIVAELVPDTGVEFQFVQFNNADSGLLSTPFTVTAQRFADSYEFNNSWPYATEIALGQAQFGHSFHKPAIYDPSEDIDLFKVDLSTVSTNHRLRGRTMNHASGLNTSMQVLCLGERELQPAGGDWEGAFGAWPFHFAPNVVQQAGPLPGSRDIFWDAQKFSAWTQGGTNYRLTCDAHLLQVERSSGTPGASLTYTIFVDAFIEPTASLDGFENDDDLTGAKFHDCGVHEHNFVDDAVDWVGPFGLPICQGNDVGSFDVLLDGVLSGTNICIEASTSIVAESKGDVRAIEPSEIIKVVPCANYVPEESGYQIIVTCECVPPPPT